MLDLRELGIFRRAPAPVQPVVEQIFTLGLEWVVGAPEGDHVVVGLLGAGDLDELHGTGAPITDGLDPGGWALFVVGFEILVVGEGALALEQTKAAGVGVGEGADLEAVGVGEGTPDLFAMAGCEEQAVGIVDRGPIVVKAGSIVGVEEEHAGERGDARLGDVGAGVEGDLGIEDRGLAGADGEAERPGGAGTVEQGVDDDGGGSGGGALEPEGLEDGELLAGRVGGLDGEAAGREAVALALGDRAEVAGAEEGANLVEIVGAVERVMEAEAGETEIGVGRGRGELVEGEQAGVIRDGLGLAVGDLEELDLVLEEEAEVEELGREVEALPPP